MFQISLERMDEIFGVADLAIEEDLGVAAKHAKTIEDVDEVEHQDAKV